MAIDLYNGTNGDDLFSLETNIGQLTITLINPYSGESIFVDDEKNINEDIYHGMNGNDVVVMTNFGDAVFIANALNQQIISDIEVFIAGDGGDVIHLAHNSHVLGDIIIFGGEGDDILWSNVGNDQIYGAGGNDQIDGGPGNDHLEGEDDNDAINGGSGHDYIDGGNGNDVLYGGNWVAPITIDKDFSDDVVFPHLMEGVNIANLIPPGTVALGVKDGNLHVDEASTATLTFREGFAGYNNTLGVYSIADDGTIQMGTILWANTKTAGIDTPHTITLPVGAEGGDFGFFILADGDRVNNYTGLNLTNPGNIHFVYDYGLVTERAATIYDANSHVKVVYDDGVTERVLTAPDYHTTERGGSTAINHDGAEHVVSGLVSIGQHDVLRIGFEDLPNLGDADYEDVFFDINIDEKIIEGNSENGNDTLIGGAGNDTLYGQNGNDKLFVGQGADEIYGGRGDDKIVFTYLDNQIDVIHGFEMGVNNDELNITDILTGYDPLTDLLSDFVQVEALNGDTHIRVNADGDHGGTYTAIAIMAGVETTLAEMIASGNIVADHHVNA